MTLRADPDQLVAHAGELYGEACTFNAMHYYLGRVGDIPYQAWGEMPWSDRWRNAWEHSVDNRVIEADTIRDQAVEASGRILEAAANYADADVSAAAVVESTNPDTAPYISAYLKGAGPLRAHPGRPAPVPVFPTLPLGYTPDKQYPSDDPRWQALYGERFPSITPVISSDVNGNTVSSYAFQTVENDGLDDFVREHYGTLAGADDVMQRFAPGSKRVFADVIRPAWSAVPSIIDNRSQMVGSVGNTYTQIHDELTLVVGALNRTWQGQAADTYHDYATSFLAYLRQIGDQATWLGGQGQKTANLIRDLRNQYAQLGVKHIKRITDLYQKYVSTMSTTAGRVFECSSPAGAAKALVGAIQDMTSEMTAREDAAMDQALDLLTIESRALAGSPDFSDPQHDAVPFPSDLLDTGGWDSGWVHK